MKYPHAKIKIYLFKAYEHPYFEQCFCSFLFSRKALPGTLPFLSLSPLFPPAFLLIFEPSWHWGPFLPAAAEAASSPELGSHRHHQSCSWTSGQGPVIGDWHPRDVPWNLTNGALRFQQETAPEPFVMLASPLLHVPWLFQDSAS